MSILDEFSKWEADSTSTQNSVNRPNLLSEFDSWENTQPTKKSSRDWTFDKNNPLAGTVVEDVARSTREVGTGIGQSVIDTIAGASQAAQYLPGVNLHPAQRELINRQVTSTFDPEMQAYKEEFGDSGAAKTGRIAGSFLQGLALPAARGATITSDIGLGGLYGGGIGALQYTKEGESKAPSIIMGGVLGATVPAVIHGARAILSPTEKLQKYINVKDVIESPAYKSGKRLEKVYGDEIPLDELSGSKEVQKLAATVRGSKYSKAIEDVEFSNIATLHDKIKSTSRVLSGIADEHIVGNRIAEVVKSEKNRLQSIGRDAMDDALNTAKRTVGDAQFIQPTKTLSAIREEIAALSAPGVAKTQTTLAEIKELQSMEQAIAGVGKFSIKGIQKELHNLGEEAAGTGAIFADRATAAGRRVAIQAKTALAEDLKDAANISGLHGEAAKALGKARDTYRLISANIDDLNSTALGRLLNKKDVAKASPEEIVSAFHSIKSPSEKNTAIDLMNSHDPDIVGALRRNFLERAITASKPSDSATARQYHGIDPKKLANEWKFGKNSDFDVLFRGDKKAFNDLTIIRARLARMADLKPVAGGRGFETEDVEKTRSAIGASMGYQQSWIFLIPAWLRGRTPKQIADAMYTPEGRKALLDLTDPRYVSDTKRITNAIIMLDGAAE